MRTLSLRELNRATLARQFLLERRRLPAAEAVKRLAGLQAQWPPAPYVGLWSRLDGFDRRSLERGVTTGRIVKATLMRGTLHLVNAAEYPTYAAALSAILTWPDAAALADAARIETDDVRRLGADGPFTLRTALDYLERRHGHTDVHARRVWHAVRIRAHLHHAPETALWDARPTALFVPLDEPAPIDPAAARRELIRRYLGAFGPSTRADISDWSGMRVADFEPALEELEPLRRFVNEEGRQLLDLPRAPLPPPDVPAPARLLPKWDSALLAYSDRRRVLPQEYRRTVIAKNGDVAQTFLVDGVVAGIWSSKQGHVSLEPFSPLPRAARRELEDEAARLDAFLR